ncbi:glycosyltransferase family 2 protein [Xanthovirga aplysinae]|uniref:glycosyltransferase family 2 protein n=1 Tax=Xanthovirga aplysinae TaxID=2529853 RepID=UPI001CA3F3B6|nr:glycosyltransferase family 2 protein [Xanthovirga aplysinae]
MIYIVIPVYNRKEITRVCLGNLRKQTCKNFETIVVDDGSSDGTSQMIKDQFPEVVLLRGDGNLWWSGAMNLGIKYVLTKAKKNDHILALNDDLEFSSDYICNCQKLILKSTPMLIGSVVTALDNRDRIIQGGVVINWYLAKGKQLNYNKRLSSFPKGYFTEVSVLTGRGVMIPVEVINKIGIYNEKHYRHAGDHELPRRAQKAGYKLVVSYDAVVHMKDGYEVNHINHLPYFSLKDIGRYFFDVKSSYNLKYRFWFAYDASSNFLMGTLFLFFDLIRVTGHFFKNLKLNLR